MPHNFQRVQRPENSTLSHKSVLTRTEGNSISTDCALQRAREENQETAKASLPIQLREKEKETESDSTTEDQATEEAKTDPTPQEKKEKNPTEKNAKIENLKKGKPAASFYLVSTLSKP
jgi:protein subunit release factor B